MKKYATTLSAVLLSTLAACSAGDPTTACLDASRLQLPDAIDVCHEALGEQPTPLVAGALAIALSNAEVPAVVEIEALAAKYGDQPGGAEAWHAVGRAHEDDSDRALVGYLRALAHRNPAETRQRVRDYAEIYHHLTKLKRFREALHYAALAYDLATATREVDVRGYVYTGVAGVLYDIGDMRSVESLAAEADGVIDRSNKFSPHLQALHGIIERAKAHPKLAIGQFELALEAARARGYSDLIHDVTFELAVTYLSLGQVDKAAAVVAADTFEKPTGGSRSKKDEWARHMALVARVNAARGRNGDALKIIEDAMPLASPPIAADLEAIRGQALMQLGDLDGAERVLLKAAATYDDQRSELGFDALKPWLAASQRAPLEDLFTIAVTRQRDLEAFGIVQRATARSFLDGLSEGRDEGTSVADDLMLADERVTGLTALGSLRSSQAVKPPAVNQLVTALADVHVLTYFRARDKLWLIDLPAGGHPRAIDLGRVSDLRELIEARADRPDERATYEALGQRLLPAEVELAPGEPLYVAPDELIRDVPFHALVRDGAFLIERDPVVTEPSAAVLAALRVRTSGHGAPVVVGNATNNLPAAEHDAIDVGTRMGVAPHLGDKATRANVIGSANARLLHVATHTTPTPLGLALLLADGPLSAAEIIDGHVHPALVVLASCSTANPRDKAELGPLAAAFLAAGSQTVIASRLSVSEDVAFAYTRAFYEADGVHRPASASSIAQRQLIAAGTPISAWSTFEVFGLTTGGDRWRLR